MASIGSTLTNAAWGVKSGFDYIEKRVFSDTKAAKKVIGVATNLFELLVKNPEFVKSLKTVKAFIKVHDFCSGVSGIIGKVFGEPKANKPKVAAIAVDNNNDLNLGQAKSNFDRFKEGLSNGWQATTGFLIPVLWAVADFAAVKKAAQDWGFIKSATKVAEQANVASNLGKASVFGKIAKVELGQVVIGAVIIALALSIVNDATTVVKTALQESDDEKIGVFQSDQTDSKLVNAAKYYWYNSEPLRQKIDVKAITSLTINTIELTATCLPLLGVVNPPLGLALGLASNALGLIKVFVFDAK